MYFLNRFLHSYHWFYNFFNEFLGLARFCSLVAYFWACMKAAKSFSIWQFVLGSIPTLWHQHLVQLLLFTLNSILQLWVLPRDTAFESLCWHWCICCKRRCSCIFHQVWVDIDTYLFQKCINSKGKQKWWMLELAWIKLSDEIKFFNLHHAHLVFLHSPFLGLKTTLFQEICILDVSTTVNAVLDTVYVKLTTVDYEVRGV